MCPPPPQETLGWFKVPLQNGSTVYRPLVPALINSHILRPLHTTAQATPITGLHVLTTCTAQMVYTVLSRKSAHGRCILLSQQTGGWALFRVFPHSTLKERLPLFTYTSSTIAVIEQQARVSQSPPSTSTSLESLATSPLTTSSSLPPSAG